MNIKNKCSNLEMNAHIIYITNEGRFYKVLKEQKSQKQGSLVVFHSNSSKFGLRSHLFLYRTTYFKTVGSPFFVLFSLHKVYYV